MANLDFIVVPVGLYLKNHLALAERLQNVPKIFHTNYFLKDDGKFLNSMSDKKIWLMWMEWRVHNEFSAIETPIGFIPRYEDLKALFWEILNKDYTQEEYKKQFSIRICKLMEKIERIEVIYEQEEDIPEVILDHIKHERKRLLDAKDKFGKETILPSDF